MSLMKSHFLKLLVKFQAEKFLISGYLMTKNSAVSYKLVSYMRVLTVCELRTTETIL